MAYCIECGNELRPTAVVCPKCGSPVPKEGAVSSVLLVVLYVAGVIIPFIGIAGGVILLAKGNKGHGLAITALSVAAFVFWFCVTMAAETV